MEAIISGEARTTSNAPHPTHLRTLRDAPHGGHGKPLGVYVSFTPFVNKLRRGLRCQWFQHLQEVLQNGRYFGAIGQRHGGTIEA